MCSQKKNDKFNENCIDFVHKFTTITTFLMQFIKKYIVITTFQTQFRKKKIYIITDYCILAI